MVRQDTVMLEEGFVVEEGELINKRSVVLMNPDECPENKVSSGCGNQIFQLEIHIMIEGCGAEDSSKRKLAKEVLGNEVLFTPIYKLDLVS